MTEPNDIYEENLKLKKDIAEIRKIVAESNAWHTAEASIAMHKLRKFLGMPT